MTSNSNQIRVTSEDPEPLKCVDRFWNYLSINDASCIDYFKSIYTDQMVIFKFYDQSIRDKALGLPDFETKLAECKLKLHGATLQGSDHRTIFVNRLPTCLFCRHYPVA